MSLYGYARVSTLEQDLSVLARRAEGSRLRRRAFRESQRRTA